MAREKFEDRSMKGNINVACKFDDGSVRYWADSKQNIIDEIIRIVRSYSKQGYVLTLRQLHYQFVGHNPKYVNHQTAYKKLGSILDDCRYAGLIDWNAIEDRGRVPHLLYAVSDMDEALQDTIDYYRLNRQAGQNNIVEVWTEKDALSGIFKRVTERYHVRLVVNKGYTSSSAAYSSYMRFIAELIEGRKITILYFGDHDPSGLDMIRDIKDRLMLFFTQGDKLRRHEGFMQTFQNWWDAKGYTVYDLADYGYITYEQANELIHSGDEGSNKYDKASDAFDAGQLKWFIEEHDLFNVKPIGLTKQQIDFYNLPPNPTKITDTRAGAYIKQFGRTCWEVDALDAIVLNNIIDTNIREQIDMDLYEKVLEDEKEQIKQLKNFLGRNEEDDNN